MKNLAKLNGAKALSKNEQKSINGGGNNECETGYPELSGCNGGERCVNGICVPFGPNK